MCTKKQSYLVSAIKICVTFDVQNLHLRQHSAQDFSRRATRFTTIGSRALSFSDPYFHFTCLSVCPSVIRSVCPQLRS